MCVLGSVCIYRGAFGTRCITLEPSEVTSSVYIKKVRFGRAAYVESHMKVPAYRRISFTLNKLLYKKITIRIHKEKRSKRRENQ